MLQSPRNTCFLTSSRVCVNVRLSVTIGVDKTVACDWERDRAHVRVVVNVTAVACYHSFIQKIVESVVVVSLTHGTGARLTLKKVPGRAYFLQPTPPTRVSKPTKVPSCEKSR